MLIIEEILKRKKPENEKELDLTFKKNLIDSINEYNLELKDIDCCYDFTVVCREITESCHSSNLLLKLYKSNGWGYILLLLAHFFLFLII